MARRTLPAVRRRHPVHGSRYHAGGAGQWFSGAEEPFADGFAALAEDRWEQARSAFEAGLARGATETAEACFGLAMALWWLGENQACVERCSRAYALFRASDDVAGAARCAVWLALTHKSNFANFPAANGWGVRAEDRGPATLTSPATVSPAP